MSDDAIMRAIRARHSDIPQDPLFEMTNKSTADQGEKPRAPAKPKIHGWRKCPECQKEKVAVIRVLGEDHRPYMILRDHDRITHKGRHRFQCAGSGTEITDLDAN